jgi:hypothetical protein
MSSHRIWVVAVAPASAPSSGRRGPHRRRDALDLLVRYAEDITILTDQPVSRGQAGR